MACPKKERSSIPRPGDVASDGKALPESVELPSPLELAKIAAALSGKRASEELTPDMADDMVRQAALLYLRALLFQREHQGDSLVRLAMSVGDIFIHRDSWFAEKAKHGLLLKLDARWDEVRQFLADHGLKFTRARSVLTNWEAQSRYGAIREYLRLQKKMTGVSIKPEHGATQKESEEGLERAATKIGWSKLTWKDEAWPHILERFRVGNAEGKTYQIPESMLLLLVEWKRGRKRSGGEKSVETASVKNPKKHS